MKVLVYSKPGCPMCSGLKLMLNKNNIKFDVCEDVDYMKTQGITSLPMLLVNDKLMNYKEALAWIREQY